MSFSSARSSFKSPRKTSRQRMVYIVNDSEAKILIVDPMFQSQVDSIRGQVPGIKKIIWTGQGRRAVDPLDENYEDALTSADLRPLRDAGILDDDVAQIYYTSGTTGRPKGVMLSHKNVATHPLGTVAELHLTDSDVWIHVAPLFHLADGWATWAITLVGGTHVLVREFDSKTVFETIEREKVTITNLIPTMLKSVCSPKNVSAPSA